VRARSALTPYFNDVHERTPYHFKRHAIQNCLYGVDIDAGAVEIAKLRLWLSLVVDEEDVKQIKPLPNLDYKVVAGNSLIGFPFKSQRQTTIEQLKQQFFDETDYEKKTKLKSRIDQQLREAYATSRRSLGYEVSFDFEVHFSEVFHNNGGFDITLGNPPYVRVQNLKYDEIDLYKRLFPTAWKRIDISTLFLERATRLINFTGVCCYISSNQFLSTEYGRKIREFFLGRYSFTKIIDFADLPVFYNTLTYVSIFQFGLKQRPNFAYARVENLPFDPDAIRFELIPIERLSGDTWVLGGSKESSIVEHIRKGSEPLRNYGKCWAGIITGRDETLLFDADDARVKELEPDLLMPVLRAQGCERYAYATPSKLTIYPYREANEKTVIFDEPTLKKRFPKTYRYLQSHKDELYDRRDSRSKIGDKSSWYGLIRFGRLATFKKKKIVSPGEVKSNKFALDVSGSAFSCARVFAITTEHERLDLLYLLGLLNSRLIEFYLHKTAPLKQGGYYSYSASVIDAIPVRFGKNTDEIIRNVVSVLETKRGNAQADTTAREREIDVLVYQLYGLTEEEIAIVEGKSE